MKIIKTILYSLCILCLCACGNFDDFNTDPNKAPQATSPLLATPLIKNFFSPTSYTKTYIDGDCLAKQMVWMEFLSDYNYNSVGRISYGDYKILINAKKMVDVAPEDTKSTYEALALFLKAYKLFYYSMRVGDTPYSEALLAEETGVYRPKLDSQEDVMKYVLEDLTRSSELFATGKTFGGDIAFGGDPQKWKIAVDGFRLKVLMFLSKRADDSSLDIKNKFKDIVANGSLMTSNDDNVQLEYSNKGGQIFAFNRTTSAHYFYCILSNVVIDMLKSHNDRRLFYLAEPAKTLADQGLAANDWNAYKGMNPTDGFGDLQKQYADKDYSELNLRYIDEPSGEPTIRIGYAEQNLILAEAALRGWIIGDPATYYNNAIEAAMKFITTNTPAGKYNHGMDMDDSYIATYQDGNKVKLSGDFENKLRQIITQKYLMYTMQYTFDSYFEYRRTGYPELPINPDTNLNPQRDKMPTRWMYSDWEYNYNEKNIWEAVNRQFNGEDDPNGVLWIMK